MREGATQNNGMGEWGGNFNTSNFSGTPSLIYPDVTTDILYFMMKGDSHSHSVLTL